LPPLFSTWRQLRVDVDPQVKPDILADLTDLSPIPDNTADAVWAAHCIEHLYAHEVKRALSEFLRVLNPTGFLCILVPDLQTVANYVAADQLHEVIYQSAAGPVTAHDIFFGHSTAIAAGRPSMAHRCGFTPSLLLQHFREVPFAEVALRRRPGSLELLALGRKSMSKNEAERAALLSALDV
jgi:SAM-dependent methyltransferase